MAYNLHFSPAPKRNYRFKAFTSTRKALVFASSKQSIGKFLAMVKRHYGGREYWIVNYVS